jgi:GT2 family glycosyltransferase
MTKLSIILVSYNTQQVIEDCLNSLIKYVDLNEIEIIVIDNDSTDKTVDMIRKKFCTVMLIENESNLGFAKANNIGISHSIGDNILLLNTDTIIIEDFISPILEYLKDTANVGILGCRVLNKDQTLQYNCWNAPNILTGLSFYTLEIIKSIFNPFQYWIYMKGWDHSTVRDVDCISGCFMWIRREVINAFGGLDENIFMYYEDSEYCIRISKLSDYRVVYFPHTKIIHLGGGSGDKKDPNPKVLKYNYQSFNYYLKVTYGSAYQNIFKILCELVWRVELPFFYLLKKFNKFNKKYRLIKWMLSQ